MGCEEDPGIEFGTVSEFPKFLGNPKVFGGYEVKEVGGQGGHKAGIIEEEDSFPLL